MTNSRSTGFFLLMLAASGIAAAGDEVPVGRAEAMACRSEIAAFHDERIKSYAKFPNAFCNSPKMADSEETRRLCKEHSKIMQDMIDADDIDWWLKGNQMCSYDNTCFGPHTYESDDVIYKRSGLERMAKGGDPAYSRLDTCIANAWLERNPESSDDDKSEADSNDTRTAATDSPEASATAEKSDPIRAARCAEALAAQDAEFNSMSQKLNEKLASDKSASGSKALFQLGMYITSKRLDLLDEHCKGEPQYSQYAPTKAHYDSALTGCRQVANDGGESCKPLPLW
jgi:hypothetical protein